MSGLIHSGVEDISEPESLLKLEPAASKPQAAQIKAVRLFKFKSSS